jgi:hypothetical protein
LLGGRLAQRQAALREMMAAGALSTFALGLLCVPVVLRAGCVPQREIFCGTSGQFNFEVSCQSPKLSCVFEN